MMQSQKKSSAPLPLLNKAKGNAINSSSNKLGTTPESEGNEIAKESVDVNYEP